MSHIVFFIATLIALSIAISAVSVALKGLSYAMQERAEASAQQVGTLIRIVDGGYNTDKNLLWIYVKNLGETTLDVNGFDIFLNGRYVGSCGATLPCLDEDGDGVLVDGEVMEVNIAYPLTPGSYRLRAVSQYGVYSDYEVVVG